MTFECPVCGDEFGSEEGRAIHRGRYCEPPDWQDPEVLKRLYHDEGLTLEEIGTRVGHVEKRCATTWKKTGSPANDRSRGATKRCCKNSIVSRNSAHLLLRSGSGRTERVSGAIAPTAVIARRRVHSVIIGVTDTSH